MRFTSCLASLCIGILSAAVVLADIPKESDVPPLLKKLKSGNAKARADAAKELGEIGMVKSAYTKQAIPALLKAAKEDKDPAARRAALIALGQVEPEPEEAMPVFIEGLKNKNDQIKMAAAEGVSHLGSQAKEALVELRKIREETNKLDDKTKMKKRQLMQSVNEAMRAIQETPRKKK